MIKKVQATKRYKYLDDNSERKLSNQENYSEVKEAIEIINEGIKKTREDDKTLSWEDIEQKLKQANKEEIMQLKEILGDDLNSYFENNFYRSEKTDKIDDKLDDFLKDILKAVFNNFKETTEVKNENNPKLDSILNNMAGDAFKKFADSSEVKGEKNNRK